MIISSWGLRGRGGCVLLNSETPWFDLYSKTFCCILRKINNSIHYIVVDIWAEILHQLSK